MQAQSQTPPTQLTIPDKEHAVRALIVETDPLWAHAHASILQANGCAVTVTSDTAEALDLIQACYFHIVILEDQQSDLLQMIYLHRWIESMVVCVCSEKVVAYGLRAYWYKDDHSTGVNLEDVLYFSKSDYFPKRFWKRIQQELIKNKLVGRLSIAKPQYIKDLSYQMTNNLIEHIEAIRVSNQLQTQDEWVAAFYAENGYEALRVRLEYEIYDLLRRCINVAKINTIQLVSITSGLSKAAVIGITPKIDGKWSKTYILKLGYHTEIQNETHAYDNHVRFILERGPKADSGPKTPLLSSIMYDFVENGRSFGDVYQDGLITTQELEDLLEDLFYEVYREWLRAPADDMITAEDYIGYLNCEVNRFHDPIKYLERQPEVGGPNLWGVDKMKIPELDDFLPNPINLLDYDPFLKSLRFAAPSALTHGDLNANNILIRNQAEAWLIDFARTDRHHALRDFIQLESVVRFALMDGPSLADRYKMEKLLAAQRKFSQIDRIKDQYIPSGPHAKKLERAFLVTCKIRELAWKIVLNEQDESRQIANFEQYQMGQFFMALTTLRFIKHQRTPNGLKPTQALHALVAASLLGKRLSSLI